MDKNTKDLTSAPPTRIISDLELELLKGYEEAYRKAMTDPLTGLPNRYAWDKRLEEKQFSRHPLMIINIDIDKFKSINDTHGHDIGDETIRNAGKLIKACVRPDDFVAHLSGDEFAVLIDVGNMEYGPLLEILTNRFIEISRDYNSHNNIPIHFSFGSAYSSGPNHDINAVIREADQSMYKMKKSHHAKEAHSQKK